MNVTTDILAQLQAKQDRIRNMCIMAHVDHGKTTLSDHLIGSNGLIHPRLMGELRYLDSREDEQARGITMKSSSISLLYVPAACSRPEGPKSVSEDEKLSSGYLINLIDSPGHVDFCSEVSTAARLSDGALVVVDAVEGVCIQTHAVLRQAWEERVTPCLFINKIDRLILELRLTPAEAYTRIQSIVTHANMIVSAFQSERYMSEADAVLAVETEREAADKDHTAEDDDVNDEADAFQPVQCNVAFGSAYDGWAFRLDQFAEMYAQKMGFKPAALRQALWGDFAFNPKEKRVTKIKGGATNAKPMFVQFILEGIWKAYSVLDGEDVASVLGPIVKGRGLSGLVPAKALEHPEPRQALRSVMRAWLPLSEAVLGMAVDQLPSPAAAAPKRIPRLLTCNPGEVAHDLAAVMSSDAVQELQRCEAALACSNASADAPLIVYVSKMVAVPFSVIPRQPGDAAPADHTCEVFLAFGRVFSGTVHEGQTVHVLSPGYNPANPDSQHRQTATVSALYMMMGRALQRLKVSGLPAIYMQSVPAGCVLALAGLEACVLKSATLSSSPAARPLAPMTFQAAPIVRVAVEPALPSQMNQLVEGLRLLNRADPFVEVSVLESGEHVLGAAGEVHLETCVKDLQERFAKVQLQVSPPLVAFRETVCCPEEAAAAAAAGEAPAYVVKLPKVVEAITPNNILCIRVRALPLPGTAACALDEHAELLKRKATSGWQTDTALEDGRASDALASASRIPSDRKLGTAQHSQHGQHTVEALGSQLLTALEACNSKYKTLISKAWQLGPKGIGPNILLCPPTPTTSIPSSHQISNHMGLFDVPSANVVKATKQQQQQQQQQPATGQQPINGDYDTEDQQANAEPTRKVLQLGQIGNTNVSQVLGLQSSCPATGIPTSEDVGNSHHEHQEAVLADDVNGSQTASHLSHLTATVESGIVAGFQLATSAGPLCEEPLWGVVFELDVRLILPEKCDPASVIDVQLADMDLQEDVYGPFSGQVMTTMASACRRAIMEADPRLAEAQYLCAVQATAAALGGLYTVLGKRRSRTLREEMREGSDTFIIHAYLPVEASFGLAHDLRHATSGAASASLLLSHWERLQVDPFFIPTTEEEREEHGEEGVASNEANVARRLINAVRRRKGLPVEEKVVKVATKQRTLKRNV